MSLIHVRLATAFLLLAAGAAAAPPAAVQFLAPDDGAVVGEPRVTVTGKADPDPGDRSPAFDVMIVIDTSGSTRAPAAVAADPRGTGPGIFDVLRGSGPTILDAEVTAATRFVEVADHASTRIGIVTFAESAAFGRRGNAWVEQPLTSDYGAVRATLDRLRARTPNGGTDMVAGLRLAIRELRALPDAVSGARPEARKVALFMTDGFPTLPFANPVRLDERNVGVTLDAALLAAKAGIVVHTFCLGPEALSAPVVCREAARVTGGAYHPVQRPADIVDLLPATKIGRVELVSVRNATTGQMAERLDVEASGRFSAVVPLAAGANRLVVQALGAATEVGTATLVVHYRPDVRIEVERNPTPEVEIKVEPPPSGERPQPNR